MFDSQRRHVHRSDETPSELGPDHATHVRHRNDLFRAQSAIESVFDTPHLAGREAAITEFEIQAVYNENRARWIDATSTLTNLAREGRSVDDFGVLAGFLAADLAFEPMRASVHELEEDFYEPLVERGTDVGQFDAWLLLLAPLAIGPAIGGIASYAAVQMTKHQYLDLRKRDETEAYRQAEVAQNRRLRSLIESPHDVITVVSGTDDLSLMSPHPEMLTAMSQTPSPGSVSALLGEHQLAAWSAADQLGYEHGEAQSIEIETHDRDGAPLYLEAHVSPMSDDPTERVWVWRDVTERREAESQLLQAQKLESMGHLAAGIAHEINTPMQYIGDNTHFLNADPETSDAQAGELADVISKSKLPLLRDRAPDTVNDALTGLQNVSQIVQAMKRFSHPGGDTKKPIDLNDAIRTTVTVCRNEWKYTAEVHADLAPDPLLEAHARPLNQVFLNLIINATQAIAERYADQEGNITIITRTTDDAHVVISVTDDGAGIDPENLSRIFDHFFTTKGVGVGTGQGLAIAHQVVVKEHQGLISVDSTPGEGTTFTITLPITAPLRSEATEADDAQQVMV